MPSAVPNLPGLVPIWQTACDLGITEQGLHTELHREGVPVLEVQVSGKKALFAQPADITRFLLTRATHAEPAANGATQLPPPAKRQSVADRLAVQQAELDALRERIRSLEAVVTGAA